MPDITQQRARAGQAPLPIALRSEDSTRVYGSAQPTSGPAARLRQAAYSLPFHDPKHWLLLLTADRAEVSGHLAREAFRPGGQALVARHFARQARAYPRSFALAAVGLLLVMLRGRRRK